MPGLTAIQKNHSENELAGGEKEGSEPFRVPNPIFAAMNWILLIIAGLFEAAFAFSLGMARDSSGSKANLWLAAFFVFLSISMYLLYRVVQTIPIGTAYAIWTGIGAVGTVIVGIIWFREPATLWRIFFLFTLIASVIGLKVVTPG